MLIYDGEIFLRRNHNKDECWFYETKAASLFKKILIFLTEGWLLYTFVVFCQINMNQSEVYICLLPFESPSHLLLPCIPLAWYRVPVWVPWDIEQITIGYVFYIWYCKFPCNSLHIPHPILPQPQVHKSVLYVCFSTAALQINSLVPSF